MKNGRSSGSREGERNTGKSCPGDRLRRVHCLGTITEIQSRESRRLGERRFSSGDSYEICYKQDIRPGNCLHHICDIHETDEIQIESLDYK